MGAGEAAESGLWIWGGGGRRGGLCESEGTPVCLTEAQLCPRSLLQGDGTWRPQPLPHPSTPPHATQTVPPAGSAMGQGSGRRGPSGSPEPTSCVSAQSRCPDSAPGGKQPPLPPGQSPPGMCGCLEGTWRGWALVPAAALLTQSFNYSSDTSSAREGSAGLRLPGSEPRSAASWPSPEPSGSSRAGLEPRLSHVQTGDLEHAS